MATAHNNTLPLVTILTDMLRSALAWEEEHGEPTGEAETGDACALNRRPLQLHCDRPHGSRSHDLTGGGSANGNRDRIEG